MPAKALPGLSHIGRFRAERALPQTFPLSAAMRRLRGTGGGKRGGSANSGIFSMAAFDVSAGTAMPRTGGALWLAVRTLRNLHKGFAWAWLDILCQYRRSRIGPLWETVNVLVMTLGMTVVSAAVIGGNMTSLLAYVGLGIITWTV